MQEEKTEGIVLRSQDYKERHRIITLFTPQGLLSLIVRNISRKNTRLLSLTTPFCHGEYHYKKGQGQLVAFSDGTILNEHLDFRASLAMLRAAGSLANALLSSQMEGRAAPILFALYKSYHKQVASFAHPETLLASFQLKLLRHEGLLVLSSQCSCCDSPSKYIYEGESFCSNHSSHGLHFTADEWNLLLHLESALQFSSLQELIIPSSLCQNIQNLFLSRIK